MNVFEFVSNIETITSYQPVEFILFRIMINSNIFQFHFDLVCSNVTVYIASNKSITRKIDLSYLIHCIRKYDLYYKLKTKANIDVYTHVLRNKLLHT